MNLSSSTLLEYSTRLDAALRAVAKAETIALNPLGSRDCLPRSLALFAFLRRCGIPAIHYIGIQRYPFLAHAWVESNRLPVRERSETILPFTPIATIGAQEATPR